MAKSTDEILASLLLPRGSDWRIKDVHSDDPNESIYVEVEYCKPDIVVAGKHFPIYDFRPERVWRHLDMWQYKTFIKARYVTILSDGDTGFVIDVADGRAEEDVAKDLLTLIIRKVDFFFPVNCQ